MIALDEDLVVIDQMLEQYPLLDNDTLKALARQVRAGDMQARERMILHNLRLVVSEVRPFTNPQTFPDAFQESIEGLIRAVDKYDPEKGYNFSTYAVWWIKQSVRLWMFHKHRAYIPRYMHDAMITVNRFLADGVQDAEEIASQTRLSVSQVINAKDALTIRYSSMDAPIQSLDGEATLADFIEDECNPLEDIEDNESTQQIAQEMLAILSPRDQQIMRMYFGFDGESLTIPEIAPRLGVSRERVRQLYLRAMENMQKSTLIVEEKSVEMCLCGCGQQIDTTTKGGRVRQFYSSSCQSRYYRRQRREEQAS